MWFQARALITKLTEEKQSAIQLNNKLQRELVKELSLGSLFLNLGLDVEFDFWQRVGWCAGATETWQQEKPKWYPFDVRSSVRTNRSDFGIHYEENITITPPHRTRHHEEKKKKKETDFSLFNSFSSQNILFSFSVFDNFT